MELIFEFELKIKSLNQSDLALELLMVKLCNLNNFSSISEIINDLDNRENSNSVKASHDLKPVSKDRSQSTMSGKLKSEVGIPNSNKSISKKKIVSSTEKNLLVQDKDSVSVPKDKEVSSLSVQQVINKLDDVINYIDEKNSKVSALLSDIEVISVSELAISIKVNNMSDFIYDALMNSIDTLKNAFNIILNTDHTIVIEKGSLMKNNNLDSNNKDEEHPLFMDFLDKFDGEILR
jgi:vacuolar-type H+-ATPase subunit I/STV1